MEVLKLMIQKDITIKNANVLMLGITFKENCPDIRNTKAIDVYSALKSFNMNVNVYDPWASNEEVKLYYDINMIPEISSKYDAIVHVVAHQEFLEINLNEFKKEKAIIYDVKGTLNHKLIDKRL